MSSSAPAGRASILHADLDSFYASVAQRDSPWLRGRPVAVGGGVILAASYEAKRRGVRTPMGGRAARDLCPGLIVVPPDFEAYQKASNAVFEIFRRTTPVVQGVSIDEAFLDVGGLHRIDASPVEIAARLRREVSDEVGLPITVGVARTPFLAKVASRVAKPDGLLEVPPEGEAAFLHPLDVTMLWGVGDKTAQRLREYGLHTAGQLAELPESVLIGLLGGSGGRHLHAVVHGMTSATLSTGGRRGSIGAQRALGHGPHASASVDAALLGLLDRVSRRLRSADQLAGTVTLRVRFGDYTAITRSHTLAHPSSDTSRIAESAISLLRGVAGPIATRGLTLVGVAVSGLVTNQVEQPELVLDGLGELDGQVALAEKAGVLASHDRTRLDGALDAIGERFGTQALTRGSLVRVGTGFSPPQLPAEKTP